MDFGLIFATEASLFSFLQFSLAIDLNNTSKYPELLVPLSSDQITEYYFDAQGNPTGLCNVMTYR